MQGGLVHHKDRFIHHTNKQGGLFHHKTWSMHATNTQRGLLQEDWATLGVVELGSGSLHPDVEETLSDQHFDHCALRQVHLNRQTNPLSLTHKTWPETFPIKNIYVTINTFRIVSSNAMLPWTEYSQNVSMLFIFIVGCVQITEMLLCKTQPLTKRCNERLHTAFTWT